MAVFNFVAEVLTIKLFNVVFIPAKCNHIVVVYKYKENRVRKNDNFPGRNSSGTLTFFFFSRFFGGTVLRFL